MASSVNLEIVTPDRVFFDGDVEMIIVRTSEGDMGIMHDHEPVVAPVSIGMIKVRENGKYRLAACSGGFLNSYEEKTIIVTDSAEWADEIDAERAKLAAERAKKRLGDDGGEIDVLRAKVALNRAMNRLFIIEHHM